MWGSSKRSVFFIQILYLFGLGLFVILYRIHSIEPRRDFYGPIPFLVPWFGAVGAVVLSLTGVFEHRRDWDPEYRYWHWSRPVIGGVISTITVLILQSGILAVGGQLPTQTDAATKNLLYYIAAFVAGYRENVFRQLIGSVTDLIFKPATPAPVIGSVTPPQAASGQQTTVTIAGSGLTGATAVKLENVGIPFLGVSDSQLTAMIPDSTTAGASSLTVTTGGGTTSIGFTIT